MTYAWEADANTVALWHCDDGTGNISDSSGNGWTATPTSANIWTGTGKFGDDGAYLNAAQYATTAANLMGTDQAAGAIEFWFKPDVNYNAAYAGAAIYFFYWSGGGGNTALWYSTGTDNLRCHFKTSTPAELDLYSTTATFSAGTWYHFCITWGAAGVKLYINGSQEDSEATTAAIFSRSTDVLKIGVDDGAQCFDGTLDEFRVSKVQRDGSTEREAAAGTNFQINIGDAWKAVAAMQINIGDVWKAVAGAQVNIGDVWKSIF